MTQRQTQPAPRKSAKEWARLVRAWKRSGKSSKEFAVSRSIRATTLVWWAWRLGLSRTRGPALPRPEREPPLRLVEVTVERPASLSPVPLSSCSWELRTATGIHLTVHGEISVEALALVIGARGGRP
jgi:hypothetical protein